MERANQIREFPFEGANYLYGLPMERSKWPLIVISGWVL